MASVTAVYIGRFEPFGRHHRKIVQFIDSQPDVKKIVIVKGSAQWDYRNPDPDYSPDRNPFTADECCIMIALSLRGRIKKPVKIIRVADTESKTSDPLWREWTQVIISAIGNNDFVVYVNDARFIRAFEAAGIRCRPFPDENLGPRATVIRQKIALEPRIKWSVDPEVARYIEKIGGPKRIRELLGGRGEENGIGEPHPDSSFS